VVGDGLHSMQLFTLRCAEHAQVAPPCPVSAGTHAGAVEGAGSHSEQWVRYRCALQTHTSRPPLAIIAVQP
jgi:hypothetical protein